jgi:hypothetical protein
MNNPYEPPSNEPWPSDGPFREPATAMASLVGFWTLVFIVAIVSPMLGDVDSWIDVIVPALFVVGVCSLGILFALGDNAKFNDRYPPIDDKQFICRCSPGVNPQIALRVRRIVSEQLGIEYERIYPEQSFVRDLNCG